MNVSVIIPAFNSSSTIARCLDSVLSQTYPATEIIVVDDGSSDDTSEKCKIYSSDNPQIKYVFQENSGVAAARNTGINKATCEWVAFLDSDDRWLDSKLANQVTFLQQNGDCRWIASCYQLVRVSAEHERVVGSSPTDENVRKSDGGRYSALELLAGKTTLWTGTIMMHRKSLELLEGFCTDLTEGEDVDLWIRFALKFPQIGFLPEQLALYTVSQPASLTGLASQRVTQSQYTYYERLTRRIASAESASDSLFLKQILEQKINGTMLGLVRTGSLVQARKFIRELKIRKLPLPNRGSRILAQFPSWTAKVVKRLLGKS